MRPVSLFLLALATTALSGCFKPEIRQGNYINDALVAKVKIGMTPAQVQFVMGPAMVKDPFHPDRWDYVRYVNPNNGDPIQNWHVIMFFQDGKLAKIDQLPVQNKEEQLQLPTVKDASDLPPDENGNPSVPSGSGPPPR